MVIASEDPPEVLKPGKKVARPGLPRESPSSKILSKNDVMLMFHALKHSDGFPLFPANNPARRRLADVKVGRRQLR